MLVSPMAGLDLDVHTCFLSSGEGNVPASPVTCSATAMGRAVVSSLAVSRRSRRPTPARFIKLHSTGGQALWMLLALLAPFAWHLILLATILTVTPLRGAPPFPPSSTCLAYVFPIGCRASGRLVPGVRHRRGGDVRVYRAYLTAWTAGCTGVATAGEADLSRRVAGCTGHVFLAKLW